MNFSYNIPIFNNINIPNVQFRSSGQIITTPQGLRKDSFNSNPLYDNFVDKNTLTNIAKNNPRINEILKENDIKLNVNMPELEKLKYGHLMDTRVTAAKMYSALPPDMKAQVNLIDLQQAAMLHDYGKVLIPDKILNKSGGLNEKEKRIMNQHSELGYELLKDQGVNKNVLELVKYHHQKPDGSGYPVITDNYEPKNVSAQILATADKYSALREERSYKDALNRDEALNIIKQDVQTGTIEPEIYNALEKTV